MNAETSEGSYLYPVISLGSVSCSAAGDCTALGGYGDNRRNLDGLILTEQDGRWSRGQQTPVPSDAGPNPQQGDGPEPPMRALACASPGSCVVVGMYRDKNGDERPLLLGEQSGTWIPRHVSLPIDAPGPTAAGLTAVACARAEECLAAGAYTTSSKVARLLFVSERHGRWAKARGGNLPTDADERQGGYLTSISCPAGGTCVAVGEFTRTRQATRRP